MITLKQYAAAMAAIDSGQSTEDVIATLSVSHTEWSEIQEHWRNQLQSQADRGERADFDIYMQTYERQRTALDREAAATALQTGSRADTTSANDPLSGTTAPMANPIPSSLVPDSNPTAPMTWSPPSDSASGKTEPMSSEALAQFQAATRAEHEALPFRASSTVDSWNLERFALLEIQLERHAGAWAAVWTEFGIDYETYKILRTRFTSLPDEQLKLAKNRARARLESH